MSKIDLNHPSVLAQNQLAALIGEAGMCEGNKKVEVLKKISKILILQIPDSIPIYLDDMLPNCYNKSTEVKKEAICFMESLSKQHSEYIPKVITHFRAMLSDQVVAVQKRVIQALSLVYRYILTWYCKDKSSLAEMKFVWDHFVDLKLQILNMVDSDNEGIRTHSIKFLEEVVLLQTPNDAIEPSEDDLSLADAPARLTFIHRGNLEQEAQHIFTLLLKFHNSEHISSVNLMTCMSSICTIAKCRPKYMPKVIQALGDLHTTLPPTLSQSQVNSVRKHLKMLLVHIVKNPSCDMLKQWTQLLIDIGMSIHEVNKILPKEKRFKRLADLKTFDRPAKKVKVDTPIATSTIPLDVDEPRAKVVEYIPTVIKQKPLITEASVYQGVSNVNNVVALVTDTLMKRLPNVMPPNFTSTYKPISNAGSPSQIRLLSKLLYSVITGKATVTPAPPETPPVLVSQTPLSDIVAKLPVTKEPDEKVSLKNAVAKLQESARSEKQMEDSISKLMEETRQEYLKNDEKKHGPKLVAPPTPTVPKLKQKVELLNLQEITRSIPNEVKERLINRAVSRILEAEKDALISGVSRVRNKLITMFGSSYTAALRQLVLEHVTDEAAPRVDLAVAWLYEEYAIMQGFSRQPVTLQPKLHEKPDQNYNQLLCALVTKIAERDDPNFDSHRDILLRKIYLEAPVITEDALEYLKHLVTQEKVSFLALELLETICITRPPKAHKYIVGLLSHVLNDSEEIRDIAIKLILNVYRCGPEAARKVIQKYAKVYLGYIVMSTPPLDLFMGDARVRHKWTEELYKTCVNLIMALLPENEDVMLEIASVYAGARAEAKRSVLRAVEAPVRLAGSKGGRPPRALLALLDECPRGAETLLTRLLHILTEKNPPEPELVSRVRDLYATRVSDVRFLIPVLNGLTKKEILAALPKLIKLNPVVVKEVFNKLLGLHSEGEEQLPLSPTELLVALHLIDPDRAELKYIIKATSWCFAEKHIYTQSVVGDVVEKLMEEPEIPVLMMRSVLQALTLYPALSGRILNILQRLVEKEVWNNKVAWEGWVKCCERTAPASCTLAMSLPAAPLAACVSSAPALAAALAQHLHALTPAQRATIEPEVLAAITPAANVHGVHPAAVPPPHMLYSQDEQQYEQQYAAPIVTGIPLEPSPPGME